MSEVKSTIKETNTRGEYIVDTADLGEGEPRGALLVPKKNGSESNTVMKREETQDVPDETASAVEPTATTTRNSHKTSKTSTPIRSTFAESTRQQRSSRGNIESDLQQPPVKRSHKKGAGIAAQLAAQQQIQGVDDEGSPVPGGEEEDVEVDPVVDPNEPRYCICNGPGYGEMVGCDGDNCRKEWFHLKCVGLKTPPGKDGKSIRNLPIIPSS